MECLNVMIVDDSSVVIRVLSSILKTQGHKIVSTASTGTEAIVSYKMCNPDVVIMDITMPGMDGIEATEKIVAFDPDARIVVMTSHAEKEVVLKARTAGARGYILKPTHPDKLRAVLETVMRADMYVLNT